MTENTKQLFYMTIHLYAALLAVAAVVVHSVMAEYHNERRNEARRQR